MTFFVITFVVAILYMVFTLAWVWDKGRFRKENPIKKNFLHWVFTTEKKKSDPKPTDTCLEFEEVRGPVTIMTIRLTFMQKVMIWWREWWSNVTEKFKKWKAEKKRRKEEKRKRKEEKRKKKEDWERQKEEEDREWRRKMAERQMDFEQEEARIKRENEEDLRAAIVAMNMNATPPPPPNVPNNGGQEQDEPRKRKRKIKIGEKFDRLVLDFFIKILPEFVIIYLLLWRIFSLVSSHFFLIDYDPWYLNITCIIIYTSLIVRSFNAEDVPPNSCYVYQNAIFGWLSPKWPGFNWISALEYLPNDQRFRIGTSRHELIEFEETTDAEDDEMQYKVRIVWSPGIEPIEKRDDNMRKFVKASDAIISKELGLVAQLHLMEFFFKKPSDEVKRTVEQALNSEVFTEITDKYGVKVNEAGLFDLNYSTETEKARRAKREMKGLQAAINELMWSEENKHGLPHDSEGYAEARRIVKAKLLEGKYQEIEIKNPKNIPIVLNLQK